MRAQICLRTQCVVLGKNISEILANAGMCVRHQNTSADAWAAALAACSCAVRAACTKKGVEEGKTTPDEPCIWRTGNKCGMHTTSTNIPSPALHDMNSLTHKHMYVWGISKYLCSFPCLFSLPGTVSLIITCSVSSRAHSFNGQNRAP